MDDGTNRTDSHGRPDDLLNTPEAGRVLRLSPRTLERFRVTGEGPIFLRLGGRVFYHRHDLESWMDQRRRRSTSDSGPRAPGKKDSKREDTKTTARRDPHREAGRQCPEEQTRRHREAGTAASRAGQGRWVQAHGRHRGAGVTAARRRGAAARTDRATADARSPGARPPRGANGRHPPKSARRARHRGGSGNGPERARGPHVRGGRPAKGA